MESRSGIGRKQRRQSVLLPTANVVERICDEHPARLAVKIDIEQSRPIVNFQIDSDFKWMLLGIVLIWASSLCLFGLEKVRGRGPDLSQSNL